MNIRLLICFLIFINVSANAQKSIKNEKYISNSYLETIGANKDLKVDIFIKELVTKEKYINQEYGIFEVFSLITGTSRYIVLIEEGRPRFINITNYQYALFEVDSYFKRNTQIKEEVIKLYLDEIDDIFAFNEVIYSSHGEIILDSSFYIEDYANVKCFKDKNFRGCFYFYYDGNYHSSINENLYSADSNNLNNHSIYFEQDSSFYPYFKKVKIHYDTILYANQISCMSNKCNVFNARITKDKWRVMLHYPKKSKGYYEFNISKSEQDLINYAVSLMENITPFFYHRDKDFNKVDADYFVFLKILSSNESREYFAAMENKDINVNFDFISEVIQTIVVNHIKPRNKLSENSENLKDKGFEKYELYFTTTLPPPPIPD